MDTQAKELRQRAEDAYSNGWIEDALTDFLESETKNRYDFTVHHYLGNIYFYHKAAQDKALEYYGKAAKYAAPKSPYHASIALLHVAEIEYVRGDFEEAYEATTRAIELSPGLDELYFARARYCAKLGRCDEAIENLDRAIENDRNYCLKADTNEDFDGMKGELRSFFERLRNQAQDEAREEVGISDRLITFASSYDLTNSDKFIQSRQKHNAAKELLGWASLFDCWDAKHISWAAQDFILSALEGHVSSQISKACKENTAAMENLEKRQRWWACCFPIVLYVVLVVLFFGCIDWWIEVGKEHAGTVTGSLIFWPIIIGINPFVGIPVSIGLARLIAWPICSSLRKREQAQHQNTLTRLNASLSEIKVKRSQLNWHYKEDSA